jgi:ABC-type sugar transport system ATPase subunit
MMSLLSVSRVSKRDGSRFLLSDISFTQKAGQKIAIAGETGSGKSTLLKAIAGLVQPDAGEVLFEQQRVLGPDERLIPGHKYIAYLPQQFELPRFYTVENILNYENRLSPEEATSVYEVCQIAHLLDRDTEQLSGGEKQRIGLARALIKSPKLLLLDEPFSNMDMIHKAVLKEVIQDVHERLRVNCILVSHDPLDTISWADTLLVMKDGMIIQEGSPQQVYKQPINEYVGALLGSYNLIHPANLFASLPGIALKGKSLFVRPESFKIVEKGAMSGQVHNVRFSGSYYDIDVQLGPAIITVRSIACPVVKGDKIYLSLSQDDVWHV